MPLKFKMMTKQIKTLKLQLEDWENKWKRAMADYQNLQRRIGSQQQDLIKLANAALIVNLLPIVDDLETASQHVHDQGIDLIINRLKQVLENEGVAVMEVAGKEFNPATMECVEKVAGENNRVIKVLTKGYTLNDKVLRPAKVAVGKAEHE